jgi:hypothetical protein
MDKLKPVKKEPLQKHALLNSSIGYDPEKAT